LAACPALALSAAQFLTPLIIVAHFHDTGLFVGVEQKHFATAFPSDWTLRNYSLLQATHDTLLLAQKLSNKRIYLACDKGNKKGIGHFVKILAWCNATKRVVETQMLDIDAAGGSSIECAKAI